MRKTFSSQRTDLWCPTRRAYSVRPDRAATGCYNSSEAVLSDKTLFSICSPLLNCWTAIGEKVDSNLLLKSLAERRDRNLGNPDCHGLRHTQRLRFERQRLLRDNGVLGVRTIADDTEIRSTPPDLLAFVPLPLYNNACKVPGVRGRVVFLKRPATFPMSLGLIAAAFK